MNNNAWQMPNSYLCTREDLEKVNGHLLVLVLRTSGTVSVKTVHKEYATELLKECWLNSQKADVQFSALRAHCPEVNSKAEDMENCRYHCAAALETVETIFRIIVSANQLSLYGAVAEICEEYENWETRCDGTIKFLTRAQCDQDRSHWIVMTQQIKIFYCNNMENELKSGHNMTN